MIHSSLMSSDKQDWETPDDLFDQLNSEFHFTLDVAASETNHKCDKYYTEETDALSADWSIKDVVFCNPPYKSDIQEKFIEKCFKHGNRGGTAVMLLPARTDTKRFHKYIYHNAEIRFIQGRLKFKGAPNSAPFPSMICIFGPKRSTISQFGKDYHI